MENGMVYVACHFNGSLGINERSEPVYTSGTVLSMVLRGTVFPIVLPSSCTFEELKEEILNVTGICNERKEIQIVCKWPIATWQIYCY